METDQKNGLLDAEITRKIAKEAREKIKKEEQMRRQKEKEGLEARISCEHENAQNSLEKWLSAIQDAAKHPECYCYCITVSTSTSVENKAFIKKAIELLQARGYRAHLRRGMFHDIVVRWNLPWYKRWKNWW